MKRASVSNTNNVRKHYSLFMWEECYFCKMEFRREAGYVWDICRGQKHACSECCHSVEHCDQRITEKRKLDLASHCLPKSR